MKKVIVEGNWSVSTSEREDLFWVICEPCNSIVTGSQCIWCYRRAPEGMHEKAEFFKKLNNFKP